jgi:hypothetical protein
MDKKKVSLYARTVIALLFLVAGLSLFVGIRAVIARNALDESYRRMLASYPSLVFQRVTFSKYLVQGTLSDNDPHFSKLDVYPVKGRADIQFDLSKFAINEKKTDYSRKILCLDYTGKAKFLVDIDVSIDPGNIRLAESIEPESYTKEEMDKMAKTVALASGAVGAYVGGKAASGAQSALPVLNYSGGITALVSAAAGGALAAGTSYFFTDNFITALQSFSRTHATVTEMIQAARPLIVMELAGEGRLGRTDWESETQTYYRKQFEARMQSLAVRFGWKRVVIDYGDGK